jgi:hypothetical protein
MQITPYVTNTPTPTEVVVQRGELLPAAVDATLARQPSWKFSRVHGLDVMQLMGLTAFSISSAAPDEVKLRFATYDFAKLADSALKDVVLGAKLVYADYFGVPFDMTQPPADWTRIPSNVARNISSLPGVTGFDWIGNTVIFNTNSPETRVRMQQLVERKIGEQQTLAYWQGECFGKCPPQPLPPNGED